MSYWQCTPIYLQCTPIYLQCTPNRLPLADFSRRANVCLRRKLILSDPLEWQVAKFYVLVLLSRVAGSPGWTDRQRYHTTISRAIAPYDETKRLFHVSMEAFVAYLWDNNYDRWTLQIKWLFENPEQPKIPKREGEYKDHPMFKGKYSSQNMGQMRFGGHRNTGIQRYNQLYQKVLNAKYKDPTKMDDNELNDDWVKWEEEFLEKIRAEEGLQDEEDANANGGRRRRRNAGAGVQVVAAMGTDFGM